MTNDSEQDRSCYGLDTGTTNNALVRLTGDKLSSGGTLASLSSNGIPDESISWKESDWAKLTREVVNEFIERKLFPIGIDAALTLAVKGNKRKWESWARGFSTPSALDHSALTQPQEQTRRWVMAARLWTEVTHVLTTQHRWRLWDGNPEVTEERLLLEVYPRLSWIMFAANTRFPLTVEWGRVADREDLLKALGVRWSDAAPNPHLRDAAVCALTVKSVLGGRAGFLGEPLQTGRYPLRGGGIAIPCI